MQLIEYQKRLDGALIARYRISGADTETIDRLLAEKNFRSTQAHGNSRPVIVWGEINETIYNERIRNKGAKPITGKLFLSAKAASQHMGYHWDSVTQLDNGAYNQYPRNLAGLAEVVLGQKVDKTTRDEMRGKHFEELPKNRQDEAFVN